MKDMFQVTIEGLKAKIERAPTFLIFGQNCHAKALFVNSLMGRNILPLNSSNWRYVSKLFNLNKSQIKVGFTLKRKLFLIFHVSTAYAYEKVIYIKFILA